MGLSCHNLESLIGEYVELGTTSFNGSMKGVVIGILEKVHTKELVILGQTESVLRGITIYLCGNSISFEYKVDFISSIECIKDISDSRYDHVDKRSKSEFITATSFKWRR